jgi:hypothetical protein
MVVDNFIVSISTGFTGAIFFSVFPVILKRKNFKVFIGDFIFSFIGFVFIGFIIALLLRG